MADFSFSGSKSTGAKCACSMNMAGVSAPKGRPQTSLGQRPRAVVRQTSRAESPTQFIEQELERAHSPNPSRIRDLGRCPRLVWGRAVGPEKVDGAVGDPSLATSGESEIRRQVHSQSGDWERARNARAHSGLSLLALALLFPLLSHAEELAAWAVKTADLRFQMIVENKPNDPSAGVIAILPNGGTLPQPFPEAVVQDSTGKELKNETIWHNSREGFAIVFEAPKSEGPVWIYVRSASAIKNAWTEKSAFHPGLLLFTQSGRASLPEARAIASEVPAGKGARMGQVPMIADRANRFGSSDSFVSYYTGWLNVKKEGSYRLATISSDGSTALMDGQTVADWPGRHPIKGGEGGQKGRTLQISKGFHRIQYFHFCAEGKPQAQFVWKPPGMDPKEIGLTPMSDDWVQSGSVKMVNAESRNGVPLALFEKTAISYVGFNSQWIDLYELATPFAEQYKDAAYSWKFTGGLEAKGPRLFWLVPRSTEMTQATLTVTTTRGSSKFTRLLYPDVLPPGAKVSDADDRKTWQEGLLNLLKADRSKRPAQDWSPGIWGLVPEMIEPREAKEVLAELFTRSAEDMAKMPAYAREKLENIYYEQIFADKQGTPAFLRDMVAREKDPVQRFNWQFKQVDFALYELGDVKAARMAASQISVNLLQVTPEAAALRIVQLGDIERLDGNMEKAQQIYSEAQAQYRKSSAPDGPKMGTLMERPGAAPKAKEAPKAGFVIGAASGTNVDWRKRTVQETAYFTEVKNQLAQDYVAEARATLDKWQVEFPLGKLAGDFPVAEATYYAVLHNYERAVRILKAYRKQVDISKDLPSAMQLEWDCLSILKKIEPLKELAADIKKRFPDHDLAKNADDVLAGNLPVAADPDDLVPQKTAKPKNKSKHSK